MTARLKKFFVSGSRNSINFSPKCHWAIVFTVIASIRKVTWTVGSYYGTTNDGHPPTQLETATVGAKHREAIPVLRLKP